mmetsp:Transcript_45049/g.143446  ORF Transcript_45049/g.143446 Transcript_45049/m.143446 type:complete len:292 (+) Transcript_45049:629-1504(+)
MSSQGFRLSHGDEAEHGLRAAGPPPTRAPPRRPRAPAGCEGLVLREPQAQECAVQDEAAGGLRAVRGRLLPGVHDVGHSEHGDRGARAAALLLRARHQHDRHGGDIPREAVPGDAGIHLDLHRLVAARPPHPPRLGGHSLQGRGEVPGAGVGPCQPHGPPGGGAAAPGGPGEHPGGVRGRAAAAQDGLPGPLPDPLAGPLRAHLRGEPVPGGPGDGGGAALLPAGGGDGAAGEGGEDPVLGAEQRDLLRGDEPLPGGGPAGGATPHHHPEQLQPAQSLLRERARRDVRAEQ